MHRELAGGVGDEPGSAADPLGRGDVHDRSTPPRRLHRRDHGAHPQEHPDLVDADHGHVVLQRHLVDGGEAQDAGVVHEDVDATEPLQGLVDGARPLVLARDVEVRVESGVAELGGKRLAVGVEDVGQRDLRTLLREQAGLARPHAARRARDQRDLALQASHSAETIPENCNTF